MVKVVRRNILTLGFIMFGLWVIFIIPEQINEPDGINLGPRFFPYMTCVGIIVCSFLVLIQKPRKEEFIESQENVRNTAAIEIKDKKHYAKMFYIIVSSLLWITLLPIIGFCIGTVTLTASMMIFLGVRKPVTLILVPTLFTGVIYYVFAELLKVSLPEILF